MPLPEAVSEDTKREIKGKTFKIKRITANIIKMEFAGTPKNVNVFVAPRRTTLKNGVLSLFVNAADIKISPYNLSATQSGKPVKSLPT